MTSNHEVDRVVIAGWDVAAGADTIFELIADPSLQPSWDGNDNLLEAPANQRVHAVGDVFVMTTTKGMRASLDRLAALAERQPDGRSAT